MEKILALIPTQEENEAIKQQILNLFAPDEELMGAEVSIRLEERTGGKKVFLDSKVISFLEALVKEERLSKAKNQKTIRGHHTEVTLYFLPKA